VIQPPLFGIGCARTRRPPTPIEVGLLPANSAAWHRPHITHPHTQLKGTDRRRPKVLSPHPFLLTRSMPRAPPPHPPCLLSTSCHRSLRNRSCRRRDLRLSMSTAFEQFPGQMVLPLTSPAPLRCCKCLPPPEPNATTTRRRAAAPSPRSTSPSQVGPLCHTGAHVAFPAPPRQPASPGRMRHRDRAERGDHVGERTRRTAPAGPDVLPGPLGQARLKVVVQSAN
jgi:hypothetical protein